MNENKDLLLKYLCMALPYGLIVQYKGHNTITKNKLLTGSDLDCNMEYYKPYLRPMSSMTEEEKSQYNFYLTRIECGYDASLLIDWILKNHFDYRGLIPKGLAIEVTKDNNPYE